MPNESNIGPQTILSFRSEFVIELYGLINFLRSYLNMHICDPKSLPHVQRIGSSMNKYILA